METRVITQKQDLTYLTWAKVRGSSGTAGSFLKAYSDLASPKIYFKLSNYDAIRGVVGHESVNEIIVDRLLTKLGIEHLHYQLIHADVLIDGHVLDTYVCASKDFKARGETKVTLEKYYDAEQNPNETRLDFCIRQGWSRFIWEMLLVDFLILNRDRHGANIEILRNSRLKTYRPAPLFDHGLSLVCRCETESELNAFDVMEDRRVQCYVASQSTRENLNLIPHGALDHIQPLKETDRNDLFLDLENVLSKPWLDKIWEMIWKRWCAFEDIYHQK